MLAHRLFHFRFVLGVAVRYPLAYQLAVDHPRVRLLRRGLDCFGRREQVVPDILAEEVLEAVQVLDMPHDQEQFHVDTAPTGYPLGK